MKKNKKIFLLILGTVFFVLFLIWFLNSSKEGQIYSSKENSQSNTYINKYYNFKFDFPKNWQIYEDFSEKNSVIKIYSPIPFVNISNELSFDYDAIYIFPIGYSGPEPISKFQNSEDLLGQNSAISQVTDFLLLNEDFFARKITFKEHPSKWHFSGSVWVVSKINEFDFVCLRNNQQIDLEKCNVYSGDSIIYSGKINKQIQEIQSKIISSFKFIK
ncbi:MAG TPA: hypothetical protein PJ997_01020 [Candidatus Paceibacterota bacterium]|nr:hypothetical protein [Candidatus Paceibacterota bacterium]HMP18904.1 hypothetical protein [Candidatus Paceibacterota bacterium]HMP85065.1 hypothetical protein [Candidatus Paceibacterota bacterium]